MACACPDDQKPEELASGLARYLLPLLALACPLAVVRGEPKAILRGDYADPTILRDGADYYMTHSAFVYKPGFLIWHSTNLVDWEPLVRAVPDFAGSAYAPDLAKVAGKYYLYFPADNGNWVTTATDIRGPWSKPVRLNVGKIDPGFAVGEDGKRYLFLSGGNRIALSDDGLAVAGKLETVYAGWDFPKSWATEGKWLEAPKIFRRGKYFYMLSAEGGTAGPPTSHMVIVARARSIDGPWENSPLNPLVHTYSATEHWWSKGHGTMVDDVNGNWWIIYHAYENGQRPLGRQTLLEPIEWMTDGWPRLAQTWPPLPGKNPGAVKPPRLSDDFSSANLGWQWMAWREPGGARLADGSLWLQGKGRTPADGRILLVTAQDAAYEIETELMVPDGAAGGLVLFYNERAFLALAADGARQLTVYAGGTSHRQAFAARGPIALKIVNRDNRCELWAKGGRSEWRMLARDLDVSGMHHNNLKGFLALRPGLFAAGRGEVRFQYFTYRPLP